MSLVFEEENVVDRNSLMQGDILQRTDDLRSAIRRAHPYYADDAEDYEYFMVLTQSCDLVRREKKIKARYITLAAIRPLENLLQQLLSKYGQPIDGFPILICQKENESRVRDLLERLLHNTEDGFFFIKKDWHYALTKDYCVYLALSIALKAEHYDTFLMAKIGQLKDVFQAKLGWLTGNLYSRVGTPDIESKEENPESYKKQFLEEVLISKTVWITPQQRRELEKKIKGRTPKDEQEARMMVDELKSDIQIVAERVALRITQEITKDQSKSDAIVNIVSSDRVIGSLLRSGR